MRNRLILSALVLFMSTGLLWAQFWKDYSDKERQSVGESYYLAGKQYQAVGQSAKGSEYIALARRIYPDLDPSAIVDQALPSAAELLARGTAPAIGAGAAAVPSAAIDSFFLRFVGTLLDENAAGVAEFLDGSVYLTKMQQEITRADARLQLDTIFSDAPLKGLAPSAVYNLNSVVVTSAPAAQQAAWGETYVLSVTASADFSPYLSIWDARQQFYIHRVSGAWQIFAFGPTAPPLSWTPRRTAQAAAVAPQAPADAGDSAAITEAFTAAMTAILGKDADTALAHMAENVRFLRLDQAVTREELKTTLQGYFENTNFESATLSDVLDMDSVFVQPGESPVEGVPGTVYVLNVKAKVDLTGSIPFWSMYQKYYFVKDGDAWEIFAIL